MESGARSTSCTVLQHRATSVQRCGNSVVLMVLNPGQSKSEAASQTDPGASMRATTPQTCPIAAVDGMRGVRLELSGIKCRTGLLVCGVAERDHVVAEGDAATAAARSLQQNRTTSVRRSGDGPSIFRPRPPRRSRRESSSRSFSLYTRGAFHDGRCRALNHCDGSLHWRRINAVRAS